MSLRAWFCAVATVMALCVPTAARAQSTEATSPVVMPPPPPAAGQVPGAVAPASGCPYAHGGYHCHGRAIRWAVTSVAATAILAAVAFQIAAVALPYTTPTVNVQGGAPASDPYQGERSAFQGTAIGLFVGGGILTAAATLMWVAPHFHHGCCRHRAPPIAFGVTPTSASVALTF